MLPNITDRYVELLRNWKLNWFLKTLVSELSGAVGKARDFQQKFPLLFGSDPARQELFNFWWAAPVKMPTLNSAQYGVIVRGGTFFNLYQS